MESEAQGIITSGWLKLNPIELNKGRVEQSAGIRTGVFLSPYDVPEAIRGTLDSVAKSLKIDFRYMGQETPDEAIKVNSSVPGFRFCIGRHSNRLYGIVADIQSMTSSAQSATPVSDLIDQLSKGIVQLANVLRSNRDPGNCAVARDAVIKHRVDFEELVAR